MPFFDWLPIGLAIWGAALSTVLAATKLWEVWKKRFRLSTTYSFSSHPEEGHEIIIENISKTPLMLSYWELLWVKGPWWRSRVTDEKYPDEGYCGVTINPHSRHVLKFEGLEKFSWGKKAEAKGVLYLKLHAAGRRRPLWLKVYDPKR